MESFEKIYEVVKSKLSEKRMYHSICVMERCVEFAKLYGADVEKAKLVGISHDILKETPKSMRIKEAEMLGVELDDIEKCNLALIHAKAGAEFCRREFGFTDDMYDAIKYHTTGRENMGLLEKITYIGDCTGKDRDYEVCKMAYEITKKDLDDGLIYMFKETIKHTADENKLIHLDTIKAYNYLIKNRKII